MSYEVRKPFNTVNRRFRPGAGPGGTVQVDDDVSPLSIKSLLAKNFIRDNDKVGAANRVTPAPAATPPIARSPAQPSDGSPQK